MSESYLLLITQNSLKPFRDKFREMGAIYTGIGYAFPKKEESFLKQLVSSLPKARLIAQPLLEGHSFDSLRQSHKANFFRDKLFSLEQELLVVREKYGLEEFSEIEILNAQITRYQWIATCRSSRLFFIKADSLAILQEKYKNRAD